MEPEAATAAEGLRKVFQKLGVELHKQLPDGRNKSLAMTHLEDSAMRAIRALSHDKQSDPVPAAVVETPTDVPAADVPADAAVEPALKNVVDLKSRKGPRKRSAKSS